MKLEIEKIDPNFLIGTKLNPDEFAWLNAQNAPFEVRGLAVCEGTDFLRLPQSLLARVNGGIQYLAHHTAGGRVRFRTDAARIAVRAESLYSGMMSHMAVSGSAGADVYVNGVFSRVIRPLDANGGWFEGVCENRAGLADIEINMPLYNGLTHLWIGLSDGKTPLPPRPYAVNAPVVYYGSSITQAGCASRPGNAYQGFLTRWLNADHINLGFSGCARGEEEMSEYISRLPMSAFGLDYDHNAPDAAHLARTHEPFFRAIRRANPLLPIIIVTRPDVDIAKDECEERRKVIYETYARARADGDARVWFVNGAALFGAEDRDACTVDGTHPNDLGFYRMAQTLYPVVREALTHRVR